MKQKISARINDNIVRLTKQRASKEGRSLSELIQEALERYLQQCAVASAHERRMAFRLFCERPIKIAPAQFRYLLKQDMWTV